MEHQQQQFVDVMRNEVVPFAKGTEIAATETQAITALRATKLSPSRRELKYLLGFEKLVR